MNKQHDLLKAAEFVRNKTKRSFEFSRTTSVILELTVMAGVHYERGQDVRLKGDCLYTLLVISFRHRNYDTHGTNVCLCVMNKTSLNKRLHCKRLKKKTRRYIRTPLAPFPRPKPYRINERRKFSSTFE